MLMSLLTKKLNLYVLSCNYNKTCAKFKSMSALRKSNLLSVSQRASKSTVNSEQPGQLKT